MSRLHIREGGQASVYDLLDDEVTLGRGAANAIQVADTHASKHHAVIRRLQGRWKLVDLESRNGVRVNGEFRNQRWLEPGDVVSIGGFVLTFESTEAAPSRPAVPVAVSPRPVAAVPAPVVPHAAAPAAPAAPPRPTVSVAPHVAVAPRAPVVSRAGGRRPPRGEDDYEDEEGPRRPARRSDNSVAIAVLVGVGLILVVWLMFAMMGGGGSGLAEQLARAKQMAKDGRLEEAVRIAEAIPRPDPSLPRTDNRVAEYDSVLYYLDQWKKQVADLSRQDRNAESQKVWRKIYDDMIEQWKNRLSDEDLGKRLIDFLRDYDGTIRAIEVLGNPNDPFPKMRALIEKAKAAGK